MLEEAGNGFGFHHHARLAAQIGAPPAHETARVIPPQVIRARKNRAAAFLASRHGVDDTVPTTPSCRCRRHGYSDANKPSLCFPIIIFFANRLPCRMALLEPKTNPQTASLKDKLEDFLILWLQQIQL